MKRLILMSSVAALALLSGCTLANEEGGRSVPTANSSIDGTPVTATAGSSEMPAANAATPGPLASAAPAAPAVNTAATQNAAAMQSAFEQVARTAEPAVVTITTLQRVPTPPRREGGPGGMMPFPFFGSPRGGGNGGGGNFGGGGSGDPFDDFLRQFQQQFGAEPGMYRPDPGTSGFSRAGWKGNFHGVQGTGPLVGAGLGSGFLIRSDGLILTNAHVVRDADTVTVKLSDGREFRDAKVLGQDARTDIAVVKIPATNLPTVPLGNSDDVKVGDWAIAVGNPFGLEHTLTVGVISAKARQVPLSDSGPGDYLQTDASINPGNSGGPLLDIYGRVIGINNAIYSESGGNVGIGFAVPISTARQIAQTLATGGTIRRARLGVAINDLGDQPEAFGLPSSTKGVLVESVEKNSPAARAGLQPGDVITSLDGQPVTSSSDVQNRITNGKIGSQVTLQVLRNGQTQTITATLEEAKDTSAKKAARPQATAPAKNNVSPKLGIGLAALTPEIAREVGIAADTKGVVIGQVQPGSPAQIAGLQPGDVIQRVGQTPVTAPEDVRPAIDRILNHEAGDQRSVALYVLRHGQGQYIVVGL